MCAALAEAKAAARAGEVPVGAVVVRDGRIVARGRNRNIADSDPSAHAEIVALRKAGRALGACRLPDCDLYVTIEPCPMCAGAIVYARIRTVYYGAPDPRAGACGTCMDIVRSRILNHRSAVVPGVLAEESAQLVRLFFESLRRRAESGNPKLRSPRRTVKILDKNVQTTY